MRDSFPPGRRTAAGTRTILATAAALGAFAAGAPAQDWTAEFPPSGGGVSRGPLQAACVYGGELVVAGSNDFTVPGGSATPFGLIARWNGSRWTSLGAGLRQPPIGNRPGVMACTVFGGELVAGGLLRGAGSVVLKGVGAWNGARWRALGDLSSWTVSELAVYRGRLYAGSQNGAMGLRRFDPVANRWVDLGLTRSLTGNQQGPAQITALYAHSDGTLWVSGHFDHARGKRVPGLVRWNGTTFTPVPGAAAVFDSLTEAAEDIVEFQGSTYVGGHFFWSSGGLQGGLARWNGTGFVPVSPGNRSGAGRLAVFRQRLYVYRRPNRIDAWDGRTYRSLAAQSGLYVGDLAVYGNELIVLGKFTSLASVNSPNIVAFDGSRWREFGGAPGSPGGAPSILVPYRGGLLSSGNRPRDRAGRSLPGFVHFFDGSGWVRAPAAPSPLGFKTIVGLGSGFLACTSRFASGSRTYQFKNGQWKGVSRGVAKDLEVYKGRVYGALGGLAVWTGTSWQRIGTALGDANDLIVYQGALYLGGATFGRSPSVYRYDGTKFSPVVGSPDGFVRSLAVWNGKLVAAGSFRKVAGKPAANIAAWDGKTWSTFGAGIQGVIGQHGIAGGLGRLVVWNNTQQAYVWNGRSFAPLGSRLVTSQAEVRLVIDPLAGHLFAYGGVKGIVGGRTVGGLTRLRLRPDWRDLGRATNRPGGAAFLTGHGLFTSFRPLRLRVANASALPAILALGTRRVDVGVFGSTLVPFPALLLTAPTTSLCAAWEIPLPITIGRGIPLYAQAWSIEGGRLFASNAVTTTSQ